MELINKLSFYDWLISKGFRPNGADEVIRRIFEDRPDREDISLLRRWQNETKQTVVL